MTRRILLDCDGVWLDWVSHALTSLRPWGCPVRADEVTDYDIRACIPEHLHGPLDRLPYMEGFCRAIPLFPGASAYLRELRKLGEVVALTKVSAGPFWRAERHEVLTSHGFQDHEIALVDSHDEKHVYPGDVLIEDRSDTLRRSTHETRQMMIRSYNVGEHIPGVQRAASYAHSLELLRG